MGMNLDSGELLAVKEVSIASHSASREKTQAHIRELEEEVNLLKNLSHPNIVRYLGTAREEESLNILLEFVPGGSISSLLGKFGSFPESVIRMYTKQLLLGLEYLHKNGIMHRDIKGANILVDNKGCIKLADFGASKKVVELATMTGAKSMKGTPYWMAPEVILQTGHSFSADIWSVGCTIIEMATGKPPWSEQYQEVAALFHIGTTKSHPPIPDHLSPEAKDFLLKCLQKEPNLRSIASELLQHPFVTGKCQGTPPVYRTSTMGGSIKWTEEAGIELKKSIRYGTTCNGLKDFHSEDAVNCSTVDLKNSAHLYRSQFTNFDDDMCQIDDNDFLSVGTSMKFNPNVLSHDLNKSFNPMCEPNDEWTGKFDGSPHLRDSVRISCKDNSFAFPSGASATEDDDEVTETKIKAFLDEKALDLKKLQTPLYEEFYNSLNTAASPNLLVLGNKENITTNTDLPPKSKSPNKFLSRRLSSAVKDACNSSRRSYFQRQSSVNGFDYKASQDMQSPQRNELKGIILDSEKESPTPSASFFERQRRWKEELDEELERKRELMRQAGVGKASSPNNRTVNRYSERLQFLSPGK
ncbi:hypothetical protein Leryth_002298 [Lithospermum erythrorhizon]|nr:hypothetical protein Leryth_002298 [Lithospermum erythrorhizon]